MENKHKKILYLITLLLIAIVGTKSHNMATTELSDLTRLNIEALSENEESSGDTFENDEDRRRSCYSKGGNWDMASICVESGFVKAECKVSGKLTILGVTIEGSYQKGSTYEIAWARYQCQTSLRNCCTKQGLFTGSTQLA